MSKIFFCTAMIGDYDFLSNHKWSAKYQHIKFICFTDQKKRIKGWIKKSIPNEIINKDRFYQHKYLKLFFSKYINQEGIFVWVDANIYLKEKILDLINSFEESENLFFFIKHPYRDTIHEEYLNLINIKLKNDKKSKMILKKQINSYSNTKFDINKKFLIEANFFIQKIHKNESINFMEAWWNEINIFPARDQISLPFVLDKFNFKYELGDIGKRQNNIYFNHYGHKSHNLKDIHAYLFSRRHFFLNKIFLVIWTPFHILYNKMIQSD